ncbi:MAG TPA: carbonic anhydrase [Ktedonobacterales bacterium]
MAILDEVLAANQQFLSRPRPPQAGHLPRRRAAVITCMDTRLVGLLEPALGLDRGDVVELRVGGATFPEDEALESDIIRSLVGAIHLLGVREALVIGHLRCGLSHVDGQTVVASMQALGVDPAAHASYQQGGADGLARWMGSFSDVHQNVARVAEQIRAHPYIPRSVPVHALVIDPDTGAVELVARGDAGPGASDTQGTGGGDGGSSGGSFFSRLLRPNG